MSQKTSTNLGRYLKIQAIVIYDNGVEGTLEAMLHQDNDLWKISSVHIVVPPEKMERYLENNGN